jgi:hypothetical protein
LQEYALSRTPAGLLILKPFIVRGQPIRDNVALLQRIFCFTDLRFKENVWNRIEGAVIRIPAIPDAFWYQ